MKTLSFRRWLALSLVAIVVVPILLFNVTTMAVGGTRWWDSPGQQGQTQALDQAAAAISSGSARWGDPAWQRATGERLASLDVGAQIHDAQGNEIYSTGTQSWGGPHGNAWNTVTRQVQVMDGSRLVGTVDLVTTGSSSPMTFAAGVLAAALGLGLTLLVIAWLMGRYVVVPLEATSRAARRIAGGNLDFEVPESRVREVDEVRAAFQAMGDGLRESIERQAELEEERRFFIGAIAHDLRTPLFSLRGYLLGLERGIATTPEKIARYVAMSREKADQLDRLVSDLFAYTRAEYLEQTVRFEPMDLGPLLERVVEAFRPRAEAKQVAVAAHGSPGGCRIDGDVHLLERVVENLLDNALRHTPAGGTIEVGWSATDDRASFTVADTGPGIAPQDLPHLFDPLFRGEVSRNPGTGGAGLGLTIARRIMRAHGGDLTAANRAEGGAVMTGWVPAVSGAAAAQPTAAASSD